MAFDQTNEGVGGGFVASIGALEVWETADNAIVIIDQRDRSEVATASLLSASWEIPRCAAAMAVVMRALMGPPDYAQGEHGAQSARGCDRPSPR